MTRAKKKIAHRTQYPVYQTGIVTSSRPGRPPCRGTTLKSRNRTATPYAIIDPVTSFLGPFFFEAFREIGRAWERGTDISCVCAGPYVIFG